MTEYSRVRLLDMYVFKSPARIDWKATEDEIVKWTSAAFPGMQPSASAMFAASQIVKARRLARRIGVRGLFQMLEKEKEQYGE